MGFGVAQILGASDTTLRALDVGTQLGLFLPFNGAQESEVDLIGLTLMARALLSTHPSPSARMDELRARMPAAELELDAVQARGAHPDCIRLNCPSSPAQSGLLI